METPIKIENFSTDGRELHVRYGELPNIKQPFELLITGNISSPTEYFLHRKNITSSDSEQFIDLNTAYAEANYTSGTISLFVNPKDTYGKRNVITGELKLHADVEKSKVYYGKDASPKTMTRKEFIRFLKFNRHYFSGGNETMELLLKQITSFSAKIDQTIDQTSDNLGNKSERIERLVQSELPRSVEMEFFVYEGFDKVALKADVCIEVEKDGVQFYLECPMLASTIVENKKTIIDRELSKLTGLYVSKIGG